MHPVTSVVLASLLLTGCSASGSGLAAEWDVVARAALSRFADADSGEETPHAYAFAAWAVGLLEGWEDPAAVRWLHKVYELELPQGGWGLGADHDAFSTGTVNAVDTLYTVSTAGHVGRALLEGYDAGAVPGERIQAIVDLLLERIPRVPSEGPGLCLAYSEHEHDAEEGCVHNVNAQAGWFLDEAHERGFSHPRLLSTVAGITVRTAAVYEYERSWWPYGEGDTMDYDAGHNHMASKVLAMLRLAPPIGRDAAASLYAADLEHRRDVLAPVRIVPHTDGGCARAQVLLAPFTQLVEEEEDARVQAQLAVGAAGIASACGEEGRRRR